jgi:hypothetical protein
MVAKKNSKTSSCKASTQAYQRVICFKCAFLETFVKKLTKNGFEISGIRLLEAKIFAQCYID